MAGGKHSQFGLFFDQIVVNRRKSAVTIWLYISRNNLADIFRLVEGAVGALDAHFFVLVFSSGLIANPDSVSVTVGEFAVFGSN